MWYRYESIIATLCENLDTLDEPEAKASMIWIIGEYAERIDNADELLEQFLETFPEETSLVSLAQTFLFQQFIVCHILLTCCLVAIWFIRQSCDDTQVAVPFPTTATSHDTAYHPADKSTSAYLLSLPT